ncbi:MAG: LLM class flavin-dependent oxidoreductase [Thermoplasmata archaeon]|nr:LLM class flavin-dependent oxidoreductase [Thermoplasmata archaeon]
MRTSARPTFGVLLLPDAPWPVLVERARRVEAMGFDTLWIGDHFVNPYAPRGDWFEGWTTLAGLAAATTRIRVGPLVTSNTLRNPVLLARMAMTVDHISDGRLELGIGPAGAPLDYSMLGLSAWPPRERVDRLEETLRIVIPLLETGELHHAGAFHAIEDAVVAPPPVQRPRPPITVGALGARAIEVAARYGDSWNTYGVSAGRSMTGRLTHEEAIAATAARCRVLDAACDRLGRGRASIRRSYLSFRGIMEPIGTPPDFVRMVDDLWTIGISEVIVYWPNGAEEEAALEAIARDVLPGLRGG